MGALGYGGAGGANKSNQSHKTLKQQAYSELSGASLEHAFELDLERIKRGEDSRTSVMIKNIPNKYN